MSEAGLDGPTEPPIDQTRVVGDMECPEAAMDIDPASEQVSEDVDGAKEDEVPPDGEVKTFRSGEFRRFLLSLDAKKGEKKRALTLSPPVLMHSYCVVFFAAG